MHQPSSIDASVARAIDEAVLKYYPAYAAAANITGLMDELTKGVIECAAQLDEPVVRRAKQSGVYNAIPLSEITEFVWEEALGLVSLACHISKQLGLLSREAKGILYKTFLDDMRDYNYCLGWITKLFEEQHQPQQ